MEGQIKKNHISICVENKNIHFYDRGICTTHTQAIAQVRTCTLFYVCAFKQKLHSSRKSTRYNNALFCFVSFIAYLKPRLKPRLIPSHHLVDRSAQQHLLGIPGIFLQSFQKHSLSEVHTVPFPFLQPDFGEHCQPTPQFCPLHKQASLFGRPVVCLQVV